MVESQARHVWVTGARGFVGRHLARNLATRGSRVAGLGHGHWPDSEARSWGLSAWHNADVSGAELGVLAAQCGRPETIYHLAGSASVAYSLRSPLEDFERTVTTTARLLEWVRTSSPETRVVLASSAAVYGAAGGDAIPERAPLRPESPYGVHKRLMETLGESFVHSFGLRICTARLFSVYGPGLEKQLLWDLCCRLHANATHLELGGTGNERRDWLHVSDAARLLACLGEAERFPHAVVNGGTGRGLEVRDIATRVAQAWGASPSIEFTGMARPGDPESLVADVERARGIGFVAEVAIEEGLPEVVAAHRRRLESA